MSSPTEGSPCHKRPRTPKRTVARRARTRRAPQLRAMAHRRRRHLRARHARRPRTPLCAPPRAPAGPGAPSEARWAGSTRTEKGPRRAHTRRCPRARQRSLHGATLQRERTHRRRPSRTPAQSATASATSCQAAGGTSAALRAAHTITHRVTLTRGGGHHLRDEPLGAKRGGHDARELPHCHAARTQRLAHQRALRQRVSARLVRADPRESHARDG